MGTTLGLVGGTTLGALGGWGVDVCIARETGASAGVKCTLIGGVAGGAGGADGGYNSPVLINGFVDGRHS